jgi:hypothetical protein
MKKIHIDIYAVEKEAAWFEARANIFIITEKQHSAWRDWLAMGTKDIASCVDAVIKLDEIFYTEPAAKIKMRKVIRAILNGDVFIK